MKSDIWSIISVVFVWEAKSCRILRGNMFWSCLVPSATRSGSPSIQLMLHFLILRNVPAETA